MTKYTIGIDFGTQSGRAVLVSLADGQEIADHVTAYPHGVIDRVLPESNIPLGHEWALQHPGDYLEVIKNSVPAILTETGVNPEDVIGIGIDFTACTVVPVDSEMRPLCFDESLKTNPHSWVKLWKHHAAFEETNKVNEIALERQESFLPRYGGKISSEWMIPKVWQVLNEAPEIYERVDRFVEGADWVTHQLTGTFVRNRSVAGYKSNWHQEEGYPSKEFFAALDPRLSDLTDTKLRGSVVPPGTRIGTLTKEMAEATGLSENVVVAAGIIDAMAAVPAMGVVEPGKMVMAMGTSTCHMLVSHEEKLVQGMTGVVRDGIIPGFYCYEAGQSAVGDIFEWYVTEGVPGYAQQAAEEEGLSIHQYLEQKASQYKPGQSGLLALDWWNGNRSTLMVAELSGLILGMTLQTKPEEIYRALLEATAYGTKAIIEAFTTGGVEVNELYACGGLPQKNQLLMQIYADVTNLPIKVAASKQTAALGSAMFAAVAAGKEAGGYDTLLDAAEKMAKVKDEIIQPIPENVAIYEKLYKEYKTLYDYFGKGENDVMKRLKALRA